MPIIQELLHENTKHIEHQAILTAGKQDSGYEYFWYSFKDSVNNFVQAHKESKEHGLGTVVQEETETLNTLQRTEQYGAIPRAIDNFLERFMSAVFRHMDDSYHINIAHVDLKRWWKCAALHGHVPSHVLGYYKFLLDTVTTKACHTDIHSAVQSGVHMLTETELLQKILDIAIGLRLHGSIGRIAQYNHTVLHDHIETKYDTVLPHGILNGRKILSLIGGEFVLETGGGCNGKSFFMSPEEAEQLIDSKGWCD